MVGIVVIVAIGIVTTTLMHCNNKLGSLGYVFLLLYVYFMLALLL
jgi:hypothetical protein